MNKGTPVDVYRNLHQDCLSVRSRRPDDYGLVIDHVDKIALRDVEFVVQQSGRERAIDEGQKNVHAFVRGEIAEDREIDDSMRVVYDPYKYDSFVCPDTGNSIKVADYARVLTSHALIPKR